MRVEDENCWMEVCFDVEKAIDGSMRLCVRNIDTPPKSRVSVNREFDFEMKTDTFTIHDSVSGLTVVLGGITTKTIVIEHALSINPNAPSLQRKNVIATVGMYHASNWHTVSQYAPDMPSFDMSRFRKWAFSHPVTEV